jgi:hypothetical protein
MRDDKLEPHGDREQQIRTFVSSACAGDIDAMRAQVAEGLDLNGRDQATRFCGSPRAKASRLAVSWSARACIAGWLAQATCGVSMKLGSASSCGASRTLPVARRLDAQDVETGAGDPALLQRPGQGASSTRPPRAVLISRAEGFIERSSFSPISLLRFGGQRAVQRDRVGFAQGLGERV